MKSVRILSLYSYNIIFSSIYRCAMWPLQTKNCMYFICILMYYSDLLQFNAHSRKFFS
jgi:hypothetical protein